MGRCVALAPAMATEGYLVNGVGARNKALAGAGVASSKDATAASLDPAGLVNVQNQVNVSVSALKLNGGFSTTGLGGIDPDGHHDSDNGILVIPNLAATWKVNWGFVDAVALTAYANGGVSTRYKDIVNPACGGGSGVFCGGPLGIELEQTFYSIAFAKTIMPGVSVGFAPIVAKQTGKVDGVGAFAGFSNDPANFSNRGEVPGVLVHAAALMGKASRALVAFRRGRNAVIQMDDFDRYRGLLAERAAFDSRHDPAPSVAIDFRPGLTFMADQTIWFSSIAAVNNPWTRLLK